MNERRPPIEPGPEPDTTDAAEPAGNETRVEAEDAPAMLDHGDDHVDETPI